MLSEEEIKEIQDNLNDKWEFFSHSKNSYEDRYYAFYNYCESVLKTMEIEYKSIFDKFEYAPFHTKEWWERKDKFETDEEKNDIVVKIIDYCYETIDKLSMPHFKDRLKNV